MTSMLVALIVVAFLATAALAQSTSKPAASETREIKLITYNVLVNPVAAKERGAALLKMMKESNADVIALQEVAPWFRDLVAREEWTKAYRAVSGSSSNPPASEFLVLSKFPVTRSSLETLPGPQRRSALVVQLSVNGRRMALATVHLESPLEAGATRAEQLKKIFPTLRGADDAVLLGDFNFAEGWQPETKQLESKFVDLWKSLHADEPGFTWNMEVSPMAKAGSFPNETSGRIDRVLLRSDVWEPASVEIIGDKPISGQNREVFPSDHFGIVGVIRLKSNN